MTPKYEYPHIKLKSKPFMPEDLKDLMSYKSPIETVVDEMTLIAENGVYKAAQNVNMDIVETTEGRGRKKSHYGRKRKTAGCLQSLFS